MTLSKQKAYFLSLGIFFIGSVQVTQAITPPPEGKFYLTGGIGVGQLVGKHKEIFTNTITVFNFPYMSSFNSQNKLYNNSILGNLGAGYLQHLWSVYHLGLEARVEFNDYRNRNSTNVVGYNSAFQNIAFGSKNKLQSLCVSGILLLKPGFKSSSGDFFYLMIGPNFSRFKERSTAFYTEMNVALPETFTNSSFLKNRFNRVGLTVGIGAEHKITQNMALGVEVLHTLFVNKKLSGTHTFNSFSFGDVSETMSEKTKLKIQTKQLMFKFVYFLP